MTDQAQRYPLSSIQHVMWLDQVLTPGVSHYNVGVIIRIDGELDTQSFRASVNELANRNDALRLTGFDGAAGPTQQVRPCVQVAVPVIDLTRCSDAAARCFRELHESLARPILLTEPLLWEMRLFVVGGERTYWLLRANHLITDGFSIGLILNGVIDIYNRRVSGMPEPPEVAPSYLEFIAADQAYLASDRFKRDEQFWCARFPELPPICFPQRFGEEVADVAPGEQVTWRIERAQFDAMVAFAARYGFSVAHFLLCVVGLYVARISGAGPAVIGVPVHNRSSARHKQTIGTFSSVIPVRLDVSRQDDFLTLMRKAAEEIRRCYRHQRYPIDNLNRALRVAQEGRRQLFDVVLSVERFKLQPGLGTGKVRLLEAYRGIYAPLALHVHEYEDAEDASVEFHYDTRCLSKARVMQIRDHLSSLLQSVMTSESGPVGTLGMMPGHEAQAVLQGFNSTAVDHGFRGLVHTLFEQHVARAPDAIAVEHEGRRLTYAELNEAANRIARLLRMRGVGPDTLVGIYLERTPEMIISLLAVLKAGGAYLPLDINYPVERLRYMLDDATPLVVITQSHLQETLPPSSVELLKLDNELNELCRLEAPNHDGATSDARPDNLAYVMYTSGSTGGPKGVMVEHRHLVNLAFALQESYGLCPADRVLQFAPVSFDMSVEEIFGSLCSGAALVLRTDAWIDNEQGFCRHCEAANVTVVNLPTAYWHQLADASDARIPRCVRQIMVGGERVRGEVVARWFAREGYLPRLLNAYGPTEATVNAVIGVVGSLADAEVIGRPIANTQIYVLDEGAEPVPIGVAGEIYIGGAGVARGYLNRAQLTAERFVECRFARVSAGRLYRTGDLGRWRADGLLEYLGRNDYQVKIRGYRVELGEIESQLLRQPGVREAVVLAREDTSGNQQIVGYVTLQEEQPPTMEQLRRQLREVLPDYMVPAATVRLERLPLTPNGKLDRKALPAPDESAYAHAGYEEPCDELEQLLAQLWQELLGVERVGRLDNFFALGGHSLLIVQLLERLRRQGLSGTVREVFSSATLADLAGCLRRLDVEEVPAPSRIPEGCERLEPAMLALIDLAVPQIERIAATVPGGARNIQDIYPLTALQEGILFHHVVSRESPGAGDPYVLPSLLSVSSREQLDRLIDALQKVIDRHDALRTAVLSEGLPRPVQVVYRQAPLSVHEVSLQSGVAVEQQVEEWLAHEKQWLNLTQAPLLRLQVGKDPHGQRWYARLQLHHLVCDHESLELVLEEVQAHLSGQHGRLAVPRPYWRHAAQSLRLSETGQDEARQYFRSRLGEIQEPTAPYGLLNVHGHGGEIQQSRRRLPDPLAQRIRQLAREHNVAAAILFHAAYALVVAGTSGREHVVFGTVLTGRLQGSAGGERLVGMSINTLPLMLRLDGQSVQSLVGQTQREMVELLKYEHVSLSEAQHCSGVDAAAPLFTAILNYRHNVRSADGPFEVAEGIEIQRLIERTNYPIVVSVDELGEGFAVTAQTDRRVDPERVVRYVTSAIAGLVQALREEPRRLAREVEILPEEERRQLLNGFNATSAQYPQDRLIHELFEEQARRTPGAVAVEFAQERLTYEELNRRANQLAHYLSRQGVAAGDLIALVFQRSAQLVLAQIAILKVGAAYVPVDPEFPPQRQAFMIEDCGAGRVLSEAQHMQPLAAFLHGQVRTLDLRSLADQLAACDTGNLPVRQSSEAAAYVMYTSGSTGEPKGVVVPHRAVTRLVINNGYAQIESEDCVGHCSNPAFDASTFEVWGALLNGARLLVIPQDVVLQPQRLSQELQQGGVTVLWMTVGLFNQYVRSLSAVWGRLKYLLVGGDALDVETIGWVLRESAPRRLLNGYGPTECTTFSTTYEIKQIEAGAKSIPIGRPIANTQVYVLDRRGEPVPIGAGGEIYVGGAGVAHGYLNRPQLTAERFVEDRFGSHPGGRLYRTGDLGRWRADGVLEYLGRNDHQVKIRGYRIELGEIESQLLRQPGVREAVVLARMNTAGEKRLVGYVTLEQQSLPVEQLPERLREVLPEYMVPSAMVVLDRLPLTANGKLDRQALPAPDESSYAYAQYAAPRGEREELLAQIWQELLGVEQVGRGDNFFALGGHSLLIVRLLERLRGLGLQCTVREVFGSATLAELASQLQSVANEADSEEVLSRIPPGCERVEPSMLDLLELSGPQLEQIESAVPGGAGNIQDIYPLTPLQEGILFHHLLERDRSGGDPYVLPTLLSVRSRERLDRLIDALQKVIERHDILRSAVLWEGLPRPVQVVYRQVKFPVDEVLLQPGVAAEQQVQEWLSPDKQWLELARAPLLRLRVAKDVQSERWYGLLQFHHLACDHESMELVLEEVRAYLRAQEGQLPAAQPYRHHVAQALRWSATCKEDMQEHFRSRLGEIQEPSAPFGLLDVYGDGGDIQESGQRLPTELSKRIRQIARARNMSAATLFHAAYALVVGSTSATEDVVYGSVLSGRLHAKAGGERIVGMFINTLPVRLRLGGQSVRELVEQTQRELVGLLKYEQVSLSEAQRCSGVEGTVPLFTTILNYRHSPERADGEDPAETDGIEVLGAYERTNYPITVSVDDLGEGFAVTAQTDRRVDAARVVGYVTNAIAGLVQALEEDPERAAPGVRIVPEEEYRKIVATFNATNVPYPQGRLIHEVFEEQVRRMPGAVALEHEGTSLTYEELNDRANQLGRYLRACGVGPDDRVGVCLNRSLDLVVALLGVLKAGGGYVPLDPDYPAERLQYMLDDAAPKVVLTQELLRGQAQEISRCLASNLSPHDVGLKPHHLAYVIYTSGSTGRPKGVMVEHANVVRLFALTQDKFGFSERDVWTLFHSFAFDFSVWELWGGLFYGGRVVVVSSLTARSPEDFYRLVCDRGVTVLNQTPSAFQRLIVAQEGYAELQHALRVVIFGGEALELAMLRPWVARCGDQRPRLVNMYGITETTVHVTYRELSGEEIEQGRSSVVGRGIPHVSVYVLDSSGEPAPLGVVGELYVGGSGVARGYLNRAQLTAERFVEDRFGKEPGKRLYRTGDLARWRADGVLEYLGRNDYQVKMRGYRIELGEIESQLLQQPGVREAVVLASEDLAGEKRLVAYVTLKEPEASEAPSLTIEHLRQELEEVLPEYMVPSALVLLEKLPLTANGKLDRKALPAPDESSFAHARYEPPRGELEESLAQIWRELLSLERVGRGDNFFRLGGHSLMIVQLLEKLRRQGLQSTVREIFDSATLEELASRLHKLEEEEEVAPSRIPVGCERIEPAMLSLIELSARHIEQIEAAVPGGARNIQDIYPLAPLQEGILFHHLLSNDGSRRRGDPYVLPLLLKVEGEERLQRLLTALQEVIDRHDILRTAVLWEGLQRPVQVVYRQAKFPVKEVTLQPGVAAEQQVREWLSSHVQWLELRQAPLLRARVARDKSSSHHYVLLQLHHIVTDHVAQDQVVEEVRACLRGEQRTLKPSSPYRNYVARALRRSESVREEAREYFRNRLEEIQEPSAPYGLLDVYGDGGEIQELRCELPERLAKQIRRAARARNMSAATLFHAAYALVVGSTSARDEVVYGSVLSGRLQGRVGGERIIGMFINTLPLRLRLGGQSVQELVNQTQQELVELLKYEQVSLSEAQRCSGVEGTAPLFTTILNYRHSVVQNRGGGDVGTEGIEELGGYERTNYPITVSVDDLGEGFAITAQTDRRVDAARVVGYVTSAITGLVQALEEDPHRSARSVRILPQEEYRKVVEGFNATRALYPQDKLIHELFEEQVRRTPGAVAVEYEGERLTYEELNRKSNQLARYLRERGVGPDERVGVCLNRSLELVIGLLGVLKAGGAYVPLDPDYPAERLQYMLEDAAPKVVLTAEELRERAEEISRFAQSNLAPEEMGLEPHHLAYVIYTSGSTGQPKGAMNEHRGVVNRLHWMQQQYGLGEADRVLQKTPFSFDVSVWEFFWTLLNGARLIVARPQGHRDAQYLKELIARTEVTRVHFVPSMLQSFLSEAPGESCRSLRQVVCSGEELSVSLQRRCQQYLPQARLSNLYGPTEAAIDVTAWECEAGEELTRVPIGRPISNTQIYVLDEGGAPVPIGVAGEIYIGGVGVARGYLNRTQLTAERFVEDRFGGTAGGRLYRTGDLGRWRADGVLEYLGRNDHQVKIRGYRIELGEIESQLQRQPGVHEAVVLARDDGAGEKRLVGYVTLTKPSAQGQEAQSLTVERLRQQLQEVLPEYMVPSALVVLEKLPLTANGKLDRKALPAPDESSFVHARYEAPRGELEESLAQIWQELLGVERVGRRDNFFQLGGHSLVSVQLLERLRRHGLQCTVREVLESVTLAELANRLLPLNKDDDSELVRNRIPSGCERIEPAMLSLIELSARQIEQIEAVVPGGASNVQDIYPLTALQEGILFHHLLGESQSQRAGDPYVLTSLLSAASRKHLDELMDALQEVIDRHDVLRSAVLWEGLPQAVQVVYREAKLPVQEITLQLEVAGEQQVRDWLAPQKQWLELSRAPLLRLQVAQDPQGARWYALLQIHHLVCDHESMERVLKEVQAHLTGQEAQLPPAQPYWPHVAKSLRRSKSSREETQEYFRGRLGEFQEPSAPYGLLDVYGDGGAIEELRCELSEALAKQIRRVARAKNMSAATLFHAAYALVVGSTSARDEVVYGSVLSGRLQGAAAEGQIVGMFINTLPVRLRLGGQSVRHLVRQTQQELMALLKYEQVSLSEAQRCSGVEGVPLFTTILNYRHTRVERESSGDGGGIEMLGEYERTNYPITVSVDDLGEGFAITAQTDRRVDAARVVGYVTSAITGLVQALEEDPHRSARSVRILPQEEYRKVVEGFNATRALYPQDKLIHELFEEQVRRTPGAVAVECEGERLTYEELNRKSNQLARYLRERGVGPDERVGVCLNRSLELVIGLLGVLKAGGAYVPLDPDYPAERLQYMLEDAAPKVVLTAEELRERAEEISRFAQSNLAPEEMGLEPHHLAYVIYTSGSTGQPKGAMNEHRGVVNRLHWMQQQYGLGEADRVLQKTPFSFDVSVWEFFWTLLNGARLIVARPQGHRDAQYLKELIARTEVTRVHFVPSMLQSFLSEAPGESCRSLRQVVCSGEELSVSLQRRCQQYLPQARLSNLYGPTEAAIDVTAWECEAGEELTRVPIGRPISNTQIYVLDEGGAPVPIGVAGEIYIGGVGVARGYLNRTQLTAERFVEDRFGGTAGGRLYRTGDLGRWRADGVLEYLGRNDHQVKIRGYRIELGEIESQLQRQPGVREAVVLAREGLAGQKRLVAYLTLKELEASEEAPTLTIQQLRQQLQEVLPEYMVPSAFVVLEKLPLTPNGKVDRKALPAPDESSYAHARHEAPRGELEELLAQIWRELLEVEHIGRGDNFFELGGHSLLIVQLLERLRQHGLQSTVRELFESATLADLAMSLRRLEKEEELAPSRIPTGCGRIEPAMLSLVELSRQQIELIEAAVPGGARNIQDVYPLAPLQEGILFHHLLEAGAGNSVGGDPYVLPSLLRVSSREQLDRLIDALQKVIDRHDILRSAVLWEGLPRPLQVVYRHAKFPVQETRLQPGVPAEQRVHEWLSPQNQWLDLRHAPLLRLQVGKDPQGEGWYGLLQLHHLVCDHDSLDLVLEEVRSHLRGQEAQLPASQPYSRHVAQALRRSESCRDEVQEYFGSRLGEIQEPSAPFGLLDIYGDGREIRGNCQELPERLSQRIRQMARAQNISAATLFHAAYALVVGSTSGGREEVVYGSVLSGRLHGRAGGERIVGMFINTLPLRLRLAGQSVRELVRQTRQELVELLKYEQVSLSEAQRWSGVEGAAPLFTTILNYRHSPAQANGEDDAGTEGIELLGGYERTNYPITVSVDDLGEGFAITAQTDRRVDAARVVGYVASAISGLVQALEDDPHRPARCVQILPEEEYRHIVEAFNATAVPYPQEKLIHELFEEQARRTPEAVAVECAGEQLTYEELNRRANQLGRYLRSCGVGPDERVGICLSRGLELPVGLLGVLKAGGAYVALDPDYPAERLQYMLEDAAPKVVLTQEALRARVGQVDVSALGNRDRDDDLSGSAAPLVLALDGQWEEIARYEERNLPSEEVGLKAHHLAYVIYTSGSTGQPKGVMLAHCNAVNFICWGREEYRAEQLRHTLFSTSINFDLSIFELFVPLTSGGCVHLVKSPLDLDETANELTLINTVPSAASAMMSSQRSLQSVQVINLAGEALKRNLVESLFEHTPAQYVVNLYGPTETTTYSTRVRMDRAEGFKGHIGRPVANTRIYVLDPWGTPAPIGVVGEIYIGGAGVARGYLNRAQLTAERFVEDRFGSIPGGRLYRTGDLGRWQADGVLEYLGRNDHQVKLRGYRIELGEIESQLLRQPGVREAVVLARDDVAGQKRLVGYVTLEEGQLLSVEHLREKLREVLPEYMVPSAFVVLEKLPLTPNGKVDRKVLPAPDESSYAHARYEAPRGELEQTLAQIWQEQLQIDRVGRHDNFFDLGGHSLLAIRVVECVRRDLASELPLQFMFTEPTVSLLSARIVEYRELHRGASQEDEHGHSDELLQQIALMSDDEVAALLQAKKKKLGGAFTNM